MSIKNVGNGWRESVERLSQAQLQAGQSAFNALNEHDKLLAQIRALAMSVEEVFSAMDMTNMEIADALGRVTPDAVEEGNERLLRANEQNMKSAEQFAQQLQIVMTAAEVGSDMIHRMEEDIALAQEALEELRETICLNGQECG
ncbi:MAG: hypothetical protein K2N63_03665 [Lachnospiraceae bacterium]|nr:hypothetical protein [Lachnospiraceae bacterium]